MSYKVLWGLVLVPSPVLTISLHTSPNIVSFFQSLLPFSSEIAYAELFAWNTFSPQLSSFYFCEEVESSSSSNQLSSPILSSSHFDLLLDLKLCHRVSSSWAFEHNILLHLVLLTSIHYSSLSLAGTSFRKPSLLLSMGKALSSMFPEACRALVFMPHYNHLSVGVSTL